MKLGITTGTAAAAAAKAAVLAALGKEVNAVVVPTPIGLRVEVKVASLRKVDGLRGEATVIKDAGDDAPYDVTHGSEIKAEVELTRGLRNVEIVGGEGVGLVIRDGLPVPPGCPAINPLPRKQIKEAVEEALPKGLSAKVVIHVPKGRKLAEKTLNPVLGIDGGISILGTSGLTFPKSKVAWRKVMALQLTLAYKRGYKRIFAVTGGYSRNLAIKLINPPRETIVEIGDHVNYLFKVCERLKLETLLISKPAKAVKIGGGIFYTNVKVADAKIEILTSLAVRYLERGDLLKILSFKSVGEALSYLSSKGLGSEILREIAEKAEAKIRERFKVEVGVLVHWKDKMEGSKTARRWYACLKW